MERHGKTNSKLALAAESPRETSSLQEEESMSPTVIVLALAEGFTCEVEPLMCVEDWRIDTDDSKLSFSWSVCMQVQQGVQEHCVEVRAAATAPTSVLVAALVLEVVLLTSLMVSPE
jgi:hypothetical protein